MVPIHGWLCDSSLDMATEVCSRKKKDIITRKRQRENDGKRGNERKKKCIEGAPKHQKQLVEKMHSPNAMKDACPNNTVSKHYNYHHCFKLLTKYVF